MTITRIAQATAETRVVTNVFPFVSGTNPTISTVKVHTGTYAYKLASSPCAFGLLDAAPHTAFRMGYWFNTLGFQNDTGFAILYAAANSNVLYESPIIFVKVNVTAGTMSVMIPSAGTTNTMDTLYTVSTPAALLVTDSWIHVGITHKIDSVAGFLSVYVNGVLALHYEGDTRLFGQNSGTNIFSDTASNLYALGNLGSGFNGWSATTYIDDLFVDSYEGELDTPIPAKRFDIQLVTGAGANAAWTPSTGSNYQNVDDNPNNGDTDYNKALAVDLKDTFVMGDTTIPADHRIIAMIPLAYVKNLDSGPQIRFHAYNGTLYEHSDDLTPALDYTIPLFARFENDPNGDPWTQTTANAAQFGIESRGSFS